MGVGERLNGFVWWDMDWTFLGGIHGFVIEDGMRTFFVLFGSNYSLMSRYGTSILTHAPYSVVHGEGIWSLCLNRRGYEIMSSGLISIFEKSAFTQEEVRNIEVHRGFIFLNSVKGHLCE